MQKTIIIPIEKYNVLRETFEKAIDSLGSVKGDAIPSRALKLPSKDSKAAKINKYKEMISSGTRATKPKHLKKSSNCEFHSESDDFKALLITICFMLS